MLTAQPEEVSLRNVCCQARACAGPARDDVVVLEAGGAYVTPLIVLVDRLHGSGAQRPGLTPTESETPLRLTQSVESRYGGQVRRSHGGEAREACRRAADRRRGVGLWRLSPRLEGQSAHARHASHPTASEDLVGAALPHR